MDTTRTGIVGGTIVTPDRVLQGGELVLAGERVAAVRATPGDASDLDRRIDAEGQYVIPGLVDLHGDDVERFLSPRSGERIPVRSALRVADRHTIGAGVTTKFDAVAFEDAPEKNRSIDVATDLLDAIEREDGLAADHRFHARCEVTDPASVAGVRDIADRDVVDIVSLMAHVPESGQFDDEGAFERRYADGRGAAADAVERLGRERAAVPAERRRERASELANGLADADVVLASHDDADAVAVERAVSDGVALAEYPLTVEAARRAHELGVATAMGAPNVVRGGSLWDNLDAREAIVDGLVDALCSDYRPQSLLESVFVDTGDPLPERVARVTSHPAAVAGLDDRGCLEPGARADVAVVDPEPTPTVTRAFVRGREAYCYRA
jgi:alpha-D-ribose 1-methylphosphonate 5-triphosphate diphosphatase